MVLGNITIVGQDQKLKHVKVDHGKIQQIVSDRSLLLRNNNELAIEFAEVLAFPGLINSHDHLDFNLFPQTGNKIYKSYKEWGADIQLKNKKNIEEILSVPKKLRTEWGIYKNLVNGITTVVNHGEYLDIQNPVIDVFQNCYSLHSVEQKSWKFKLNRPFAKDQPFVIHVGEGTDTRSFKEVEELIRWNLFKRKIIAVHGVAMNTQQAKSFAALIWCPDSNFFMLNATARVNELKKETTILFGTDSTLSGQWNMWGQLRLAKKTTMLTGEELFGTLTSLPALLWGMNDRGALEEGKTADIVIAKKKGEHDPMSDFFQLNPVDILLVVKSGKIVLFDKTLFSQLSNEIALREFSELPVNNSNKYVKGDLPGLISQTKKYISGLNLFEHDL